MSDNICIHHTDAERDAWRIGCPICLSKQLSAVTAERDRLRDTKWQGITKLESDLATSQQEAWRLREAIAAQLPVNKEVNKLKVGNFYLPETMDGFLAISSTPSPVQK